MSEHWLSIKYREFYDIPRLLAFGHGGHFYILDCPFSDDVDEYEDSYKVLRVRDADVADLAGPDWREILARADHVGVVPVMQY